jgi:hypothetical protein
MVTFAVAVTRKNARVVRILRFHAVAGNACFTGKAGPPAIVAYAFADGITVLVCRLVYAPAVAAALLVSRVGRSYPPICIAIRTEPSAISISVGKPSIGALAVSGIRVLRVSDTGPTLLGSMALVINISWAADPYILVLEGV